MTTFDQSFCAAEQAAFRFLVDEHGFLAVDRRVARESAEDGVTGRVAYRSPPSWAGIERAVSLRIAPLRLELDLQLSRAGSPPCSLEELHALDGRGPFPRRQHSLYDAMHDPDQLLAEFARLAGVLRSSGARFFEDDPYLWQDLDEQRERKAVDEAIERTLALSKELFRARRWSSVVDLLSPIERRLGRTATARLAHARRKMQEGP